MPAGLAPALTDDRPTEALEAYKREPSSIARRRLYPLTVFYSTYSLIVTLLMLNGRDPLLGIMFYLAGVPARTLVEYLFHRYVPHGRFPPGRGLLGRVLHGRLDLLHRKQHQERPFDGWHISGELRDSLPLFFIAAPFSFLLPVYTLPALLAGVVQSYVGEAWAHYFLHFGKSRNRFLRYLKRCHLYHHSQRGMENGYGITGGILDCLFPRQYPKPVRRSFSKGGGHAIRVKKMTRSEALRLFRERFKYQMTVSSCAGSRSPGALNDEQSEQVACRPQGVTGPPRILPRSLAPTPVVAEHGPMRREIDISGDRLLVPCVVAFCLAGTLVYSFVRYWLFAPWVAECIGPSAHSNA